MIRNLVFENEGAFGHNVVNRVEALEGHEGVLGGVEAAHEDVNAGARRETRRPAQVQDGRDSGIGGLR